MTRHAAAQQRGPRQRTTHGVLRVGLLDESYEWEFVPVEGGTYTDAGTTACH